MTGHSVKRLGLITNDHGTERGGVGFVQIVIHGHPSSPLSVCIV